MPIAAISGKEPHASWGGWEGLIERGCDRHIPIAEGVIRHSSSNCHYIVWPDGMLFECYGFHAANIERRIKSEGAEKVKQALISANAKMRALLALLKES